MEESVKKKYEYEYYGIWSSTSNSWVFGIYAPTKELAYEALFKRIGNDAYKWRFSAKRIPKKELHNFLRHKHKRRPAQITETSVTTEAK